MQLFKLNLFDKLLAMMISQGLSWSASEWEVTGFKTKKDFKKDFQEKNCFLSDHHNTESKEPLPGVKTGENSLGD